MFEVPLTGGGEGCGVTAGATGLAMVAGGGLTGIPSRHRETTQDN